MNNQNETTNLMEKEAYAAMYTYLLKDELTQSDNIGGLLGSMSTRSDRTTADSAVWNEWLEYVNLVKQKKVDTRL